MLTAFDDAPCRPGSGDVAGHGLLQHAVHRLLGPHVRRGALTYETDAGHHQAILRRLQREQRGLWPSDRPVSPDAPSRGPRQRLDTAGNGSHGQTVSTMGLEDGGTVAWKQGDPARLRHEVEFNRTVLENTQGLWSPTLVRSHAFDARAGLLEMELVDGPDGYTLCFALAQALQTGAIEPAHAEQALAFVARRMAQCLAFAHAAGLAMNDMKFDNLGISPPGEPLFFDHEGAAPLGDPARIGSVATMSPERHAQSAQLGGTGLGTEASDIHTLGLLVQDFADALDIRSPACDDFIEQALHPDPLRRPSAVAALMHPYLLAGESEDAAARRTLRRVMAQLSNDTPTWTAVGHDGQPQWTGHPVAAWKTAHALLDGFADEIGRGPWHDGECRDLRQEMSERFASDRSHIGGLRGKVQPDHDAWHQAAMWTPTSAGTS